MFIVAELKLARRTAISCPRARSIFAATSTSCSSTRAGRYVRREIVLGPRQRWLPGGARRHRANDKVVVDGNLLLERLLASKDWKRSGHDQAHRLVRAAPAAVRRRSDARCSSAAASSRSTICRSRPFPTSPTPRSPSLRCIPAAPPRKSRSRSRCRSRSRSPACRTRSACSRTRSSACPSSSSPSTTRPTRYFARQQVLERLREVDLPPGVQPQLAPLSTADRRDLPLPASRATGIRPTRAAHAPGLGRRAPAAPAFPASPTSSASAASSSSTRCSPTWPSCKRLQDQPAAALHRARARQLQRGRQLRRAGPAAVPDPRHRPAALGPTTSANVVVAERSGMPMLVRDIAHVHDRRGAAPGRGRPGRRRRHRHRHRPHAQGREPVAKC